ncbi:hypothetical protein [Rivularia sp. UHCC 0363]|uniref:hypothetical protein n=1 Tax=Rivularia sp. UHCC 0363 TaxID=3110244 RepID=UPI002B21CBB4|nr:hypothetical protein [Rivularia sp. UHCC 0363]MEA5598921.1 hypothetical protein [Rivularia sp. UHCC 0363]
MSQESSQIKSSPQVESSKTYQPTPEQLERWKRIDELESSCATGFLSQEEQDKNVEKFFATDYIDSQLERLRTHRKKLIEKFKWTEDYEELLLFEKQKQNAK